VQEEEEEIGPADEEALNTMCRYLNVTALLTPAASSSNSKTISWSSFYLGLILNMNQ
jgi:hypothetical protein